jgi:5-hydroxyisourate hydrolase-like protein (transthyretin family)
VAKSYSTSSATRTAVVVSGAITKSGINITLPLGGKLTGVVKTAGSLQAVPGVFVTFINTTTNSFEGFAETTATGAYSSSGLSTGDYQISFTPPDGPLASEYFNNKFSASAATLVHVTAPNPRALTTTLLETGSTISGTVTATGTGLPLGDVNVAIYDSATSALISTTSTDASGKYTTPRVHSGSYKAGFFPNGVSAHAFWGYYNSQGTLSGATAFSVTAPTPRTGINAVLGVGGTITGLVKQVDTSLPMASVYVVASDSLGRIAGSTYTRLDGTYTLPGLRGGSFSVSFQPDSDTSYKPKTYPTNVTVTVGGTVSNINAVLGH